MKAISHASITDKGMERINQWLDDVSKVSVNRDTILSEILENIEDGREDYELGRQYTTTGRPEVIWLNDEDFCVNYVESEDE